MCENAWKDIESAPKDGTHIILFTPRGIIEGFFKKTPYISYFDQDVSFYDVSYTGEIESPTHWMPLPPPPPQ